MAQATKTKDAEQEAPAKPEIPCIRPREQRNFWQSKGFAWSEAFIALPPGMTAQNLTDHPGECFRLIQANSTTALRRHDRVYCVSHDGCWAVQAIVGFADGERVVLTKPTIINLPDPADAGLFNDGTYRVTPHPGGYRIESVKSGGPINNQIYASAAAARSAALAQYPTQVA